MLCAGKKHLARQRPSLPPGGSWQKSALRNRFLTDEECGRQCSDLRNVKTYTEGAVLVVTPLEVCDVVPACRFPPEFLSRPPSGAADCQASATLSAKISDGVFQPRHFLGRLLISSSTNWISLSVIFLKSKPFGKKNLTISFVFSFVPRCQGL